VSENKGFLRNLTTFFNEPLPVLTQHELEMIQSLNQKLEVISQRFEAYSTAEAMSPAPLEAKLDDLSEQVRKLAKTQFKANTLQESQLSQSQESLDNLKNALEQQVKQLTQQQAQAIEAARLEMLKNLLPVMDSLDAAFDIGKRQVLGLPMPLEVKKPVIAWLDGIRLARLRLLDVLAAYEVKPIITVGEIFDPHQHVAVGVDTTGRAAEGIIVSEDRRGYATPAKVLREAAVVVARAN
jgi:molecular chaperone GrpE